MDRTRHQPALAVVLVAVVIALLPYWLGSVPDYEEYYGTAIPMTLAFRALADAASPFWTPLLGIGMPQPFRISYLMHPLGAAFAVGPEFGMIVLTSVHLAIGAVATYYLAIYLGISRLVAVLCAISALFSTTITQILYFDDWFTHVVTWSLVPVSALLLLRLLDATDRTSVAFYALALGLTVGFQMSTALIIRSIFYVLLLAPLALARPVATFHRIGWLAAAALVALVCGSTNFLVLFNELWRADPAAMRARHGDFSVAQHMWGAFVQPFAVLAGTAPPPANETLRVIGFGPIFAFFALIQVFRPASDPNVRAIAVALVASIVFMLLPQSAYLYVLFTWAFRDGVNLYGILLAGVLLTSIRPWIVRGALGAAQCFLVFAAAAPLWTQNLTHAFAPDPKTKTTVRELARRSELIAALQTPAARVLLAPRFRAEWQPFARDGISHNSLPLHGVAVVNAFARGIATSPLHPDFALLEGNISAGPTTLFDADLLNVLGITHVLALPEDTYGAGLTVERMVRGREGQDVLILRNYAAWPRAVWVDEAALGVALRRRPDCGHDRFLCADFAPVVAHRQAGPPIDVVERYGTIRIRVPSSDTARIMMLSTWYRPGWWIRPAGATMFPMFEQLTAVRVPPGVTDIRLSYLPAVRLWSHVAAGIVLLIGTVGLVVLRRRRVHTGVAAAAA